MFPEPTKGRGRMANGVVICPLTITLTLWYRKLKVTVTSCCYKLEIAIRLFLKSDCFRNSKNLMLWSTRQYCNIILFCLITCRNYYYLVIPIRIRREYIINIRISNSVVKNQVVLAHTFIVWVYLRVASNSLWVNIRLGPLLLLLLLDKTKQVVHLSERDIQIVIFLT